MPAEPVGRAKDDEVRALIYYIRSFSKGGLAPADTAPADTAPAAPADTAPAAPAADKPTN